MRSALYFLVFSLFAGSAFASDRTVAEWVLRIGGSVGVDGTRTPVWQLQDLPEHDFRLTGINLVPVVVDPPEFKRLAGLAHLKELYVSGRTWHSMPVRVSRETLKVFGTLTGLERLIVSLPVQTEIPLDDEALEALAPLVHLKELRLAQTIVKGRTLAPFKQLRALELDHTRFDDTGMRNIASMPHLTKLYARDTMVTDEGLQHLRTLRQLTELDLYGTRISDAGLVHLKELKNLRKLNLLGANVTDAGLDVLTGLTNLEELNLYRTGITNAGVERLKALPRLRQLDVRYTQVTRGGVASLAAALPKCDIEFLDASGAPPAAAAKPEGSGAASITRWIERRGGKVKLHDGVIREVSMASTGLTDAEFSLLSGILGTVRRLNLQATEVGDVGMKEFARSCSVEEMELANTTVSDEALAPLANCKGLRRLDLGYTLVRGAGIGKFSSLRDLDLSSASISDQGLAEIARLTQLQQLSLKYSDITDAGLEQLSSLQSLQRLDLTGTDIKDEGLLHIGKLTGLTGLMLSHGRFTDKGLSALAGLANLNRLELVRTRTTDAGLVALAAIPGLTILNLDYTAVTDKGLTAIASLPNLTELYLDSATITDAGIEVLKGMRSLKVLNLYHTLVTEAGYQALRSALPECRIIWDRESALPTRRGS